jgi:hypothetical protein
VFFVGGMVIGKLTGQTDENGFMLTGGAALGLFALVVAYFYVGRKILGGTLWDRILGVTRLQPY